jgi:hypothetical protein
MIAARDSYKQHPDYQKDEILLSQQEKSNALFSSA